MAKARNKALRKSEISSDGAVVPPEIVSSTPNSPILNSAILNSEHINADRVDSDLLKNWIVDDLRCNKAIGSDGALSENVEASQVHDLVQDVVSDLDSLLRFIINLRFGLDGSKPCTHEEIANHLNKNLKACVTEKVRNLLGITSCSKISADDIQALEAKAERALCRRRVEQ